MSKKKWNPEFAPITVAILFGICLVCSAALVLVNALTKEPIRKQEEEKLFAAMQEVLPAASYEKQTVQYGTGESDYYEAIGEQGETVGYIVTVNGTGYGGSIPVTVGILPDETIREIRILSADDETPGLGQNVTRSSFYSQYAGKKGEISLYKDAGHDDGVTAVTGATISSTGVNKAVNEAVTVVRAVLEEKAVREAEAKEKEKAAAASQSSSQESSTTETENSSDSAETSGEEGENNG